MSQRGVYISVALEPDEDFPVADIVFDGIQWASVAFQDRQLQVTVYGEARIPLAQAIESLERARAQLEELIPEARRE